MKLGLIGTGPQAKRYASLKNGGQNIASQVSGRISAGEHRAWLDTVDAVIIATHPAAHRDLALTAIEAGKPVLCEKPLALTLAHCEEIIGEAQRLKVPLEVAHTRLWSREWQPIPSDDACAVITYVKHERDYSVWLDWAPHALAALAEAMPSARAMKLRASVSISEGMTTNFAVWGDGWNYSPSPLGEAVPPMLLMVRDFIEKLHLGLHEAPRHWKKRYDFNRRVYRALFAE